jgi:hypothetical protein
LQTLANQIEGVMRVAQVAPSGAAAFISINDAAEDAGVATKTILRAGAKKPGEKGYLELSANKKLVNAASLIVWKMKRSEDGRSDAKKGTQTVENVVPKLSCPNCKKTQAIHGPCKDPNCDGIIPRPKKK